MTTKVQKKSSNTSISAITTLEQENIRTAVIEILTASIIFFRIENAMFHTHNVFAPYLKNGSDWEVETQISGHRSIYKILNIYNEDKLCNSLVHFFHNTVYHNGSSADSLAKTVMILWENEFTNYFSTKNPT